VQGVLALKTEVGFSSNFNFDYSWYGIYGCLKNLVVEGFWCSKVTPMTSNDKFKKRVGFFLFAVFAPDSHAEISLLLTLNKHIYYRFSHIKFLFKGFSLFS
jgi:hypothetical protein